MNKMEVLKNLMKLGTAFTTQEAREKLGVNSTLLKYYLQELIRDGFLKRIHRGIYVITPNPSESPSIDPFLLASLLVKPSAIAYWSALNYYGLTEQIPDTTFVQTPKRRGYSGITDVGGQRFKIVVVAPHKFFGLETVRIGGRDINVTNPEKTVVDCLDKPQYCGGIIEVIKALKSGEYNKETLIEYAKRMRNTTILRRLGFISEKLGLGLEDVITPPEGGFKGFPLLDPTMPPRGRFDHRWGLRINVPDDYWRNLE